VDIDVNNGEYIDINDAVKRIGGNMELYKRLLGRFVSGNELSVLEGALQSGDVEEAKRLTHTIKGVSANLSLVRIRAVTTDLEQTLKDGLDYSASFSELKQAYDGTIKKIEEITA